MPDAVKPNIDGKAQSDPAKVLRYFSYFLFGVALLSCLALAFTGFDVVRMSVLGADGQATVVDTRTDTYRTVRTYGGGNGTVVDTSLLTDYYVTYRFEADGQKYQQERRVSEAFYDGLVPDDKIAVRYLPGDAEENHIDQDWVTWTILGPALIAVVFFGVGYLFHWVSRKAAQAQPGRVE